MALNFDFNSLNFGAPPSDIGGNELLGGLGLGGAAFAAQTGRPPTPAPTGNLSPFAQRVAANDAARRAAAKTAARAAAGSSLGPATLAFTGGYAFGTALDQAFDGAISDKVASGISNLLGLSIDQPAAFDAPTLNDLAAMNVDQGSIDAEEVRSLDEDEMNNRDYEPTEQEYCEAKYGDGTTLEQCAFLDEQENISEAIARGGPEASFVLPNGEVRTIMPGQDVASAFGRERGTSTFPVDEGSVTVPSELLAETMGLTPSLEDIQNVQPPEVAPDDRSSFLAESAAREQRLRDRERQTGETPAERDTRTAKLRQQQRSSSDMSFDQARKFVTRREYSNGKKESVSSFNDRIRAFKELYNSDNSKIEREAERLANEGRRINNERVQAVIDNYQKTESEKYNDVLNVGQKMLADGILKTEQDLVLFIVDRMKGDISEIFDPFIDIGGGDDGKVVTSSLGSGVYNAQQEANIKRVLEVYPNLTREQAIEEMQKQGKL